jgi:hypothetical protein
LTKQHLLLFFGCFLFLFATAQPVLNAVDVLPLWGESLGQRNFDASAVSEGPGGAAQNWDFSGIPTLGGGAIHVIHPSEAPNFKDYPNASLVLQQDTNYVYYEGNSSTFSLWGLYLANNQAIYSNPDEHLAFPLTYGKVNVDVFEGIFDVDVPNFGRVRSHRYGTSSMEVDGYGTLILPNQTYANALRIHLLSEQTDSIRLLFFDSVIHTTIESYQWLVAGQHTSIMSITKTVTDVQPTPIYSGAFLDMTLGLNAEIATGNQLRVYPVMAKEAVTLTYSMTQANTVNITIYDTHGKLIEVVVNGEVLSGEYRQSVSLEHYSPGVYIVNGQFAAQHISRKVVVRR